VLVSKNFKEARNALQGKTIVESPSTTPVDSNNAEADTTFFNVLNLQGYFSFTSFLIHS
jgi:hypothetical protein